MDNSGTSFASAIVAIVVAFVGAVPATLVAYAAWQQSKKNAEKTAENTTLTTETKLQTDAISKKADHIVQVTNSNLSRVQEELKTAVDEIKQMRAAMAMVLAKAAHLEGEKAGRESGIVEGQARVTEGERVEDRKAIISSQAIDAPKIAEVIVDTHEKVTSIEAEVVKKETTK